VALGTAEKEKEPEGHTGTMPPGGIALPEGNANVVPGGQLGKFAFREGGELVVVPALHPPSMAPIDSVSPDHTNHLGDRAGGGRTGSSNRVSLAE